MVRMAPIPQHFQHPGAIGKDAFRDGVELKAQPARK
jgi:hypothetical protein